MIFDTLGFFFKKIILISPNIMFKNTKNPEKRKQRDDKKNVVIFIFYVRLTLGTGIYRLSCTILRVAIGTLFTLTA